jgi:hypothetical protein
MSLTLRGVKKAPLTHDELDANFTYLDSKPSGSQTNVQTYYRASDADNDFFYINPDFYNFEQGKAYKIDVSVTARTAGQQVIDNYIQYSDILVCMDDGVLSQYLPNIINYKSDPDSLLVVNREYGSNIGIMNILVGQKVYVTMDVVELGALE